MDIDEEKTTFFLIVPLGLENSALDEMALKWDLFIEDYPFPEVKLSKGGLELELPRFIGHSLNHFLRIPTRILERITNFKCRDFPKLFNKMSKIKWKNHLSGQMPKICSSSSKSRLFDSSRIQDTAEKALTKFYKGAPVKQHELENLENLPEYRIYIRFQDDDCTISIDTSGDRLNIRNYRKYSGKAPIRENIARALIFVLRRWLPETANISLIDPMCGSGTFLIESNQFFSLNNDRNFPYQSFPCNLGISINSCNSPALFYNETGYDNDEQVVEGAKSNISNVILSNPIKVELSDLFSDDSKSAIDSAVILNPPYGVRLSNSDNPTEYFNQLLQTTVRKFSPQGIGLIVPSSIKQSDLNIPKGYELSEDIQFANGGIPVEYLVLVRN